LTDDRVRIVTALARAPALHFLVLGALLFAISSLFASSTPARVRAPIVITSARVAEIGEDYTRTMKRAPTPQELAALVDREAQEEMLYREALLLGLDRGDPAVEWRVIEKMEFLYGDASGDNAAALRRGLELGLQRDDVVVRSGLITKMRLLAKGASRIDEPRGAELERTLEAYLERHREDYVQPESYSLTHVFLRGDAAREGAAHALRSELEASATAPPDAVKRGDPFVTGNAIRAASRAGLAKMLGDEAADAITRLEPDRWSEPLRSPYGFHLVWVSERHGASLPSLASVRSQVLHAYRAERQQEHLGRMLDEIRAAYEVRIENGAPAGG
jgi:hypothetical protein